MTRKEEILKQLLKQAHGWGEDNGVGDSWGTMQDSDISFENFLAAFADEIRAFTRQEEEG